MTTIAFLGTGIMGAPMARNLARSGHHVRAWNRTPSKAEALTPEGVIAVRTPAEAVDGAAIIITMLADGDAVESLLFGDAAVAEAIAPGALFIDMSTIEPQRSRTMAARLAQRSVDALDAPVSGGPSGAADATLSIMAGGTESAFARAFPILQSMGRNVKRIGDAGAGQIAKTCNQIVVTITIEAVAEALAFARAAGVDPAKVRDVMLGGYAESRILQLHGQRMIDGDYAAGGYIKAHMKDRAIAQGTARSVNLELPAADVVFERIRTIVERGDGDLDHSALYTLFD